MRWRAEPVAQGGCPPRVKSPQSPGPRAASGCLKGVPAEQNCTGEIEELETGEQASSPGDNKQAWAALASLKAPSQWGVGRSTRSPGGLSPCGSFVHGSPQGLHMAVAWLVGAGPRRAVAIGQAVPTPVCPLWHLEGWSRLTPVLRWQPQAGHFEAI